MLDEVRDSALRAIYESDGIKAAIVFLVHADEGRYLYVSMNLRRRISDLSPAGQVSISSARSAIWESAAPAWGRLSG